jgi:hypothetical protein
MSLLATSRLTVLLPILAHVSIRWRHGSPDDCGLFGKAKAASPFLPP